MADEMKPLRNIQKRATEVLRKHGIIAVNTSFTVDPQGVQFFSVSDPDFEPPKPKDEFDDIVKQIEDDERKAAEAAQAEKTKAELADLREQLKDPNKGIL